jgi:hypothetical protein
MHEINSWDSRLAANARTRGRVGLTAAALCLVAAGLSGCSGADVSTEVISWPREPASPTAYASGVRLWAFKSRKRELTCDELSHARREADAAAPTLRGPGGQGMTPAQISRGIMLAQDVSKELGNEHGKRCRG